MSLPNADRRPKIWTDDELKAQSQCSIDAFVDRRLKEPRDRYREHLRLRQSGVLRLFKTLVGVDPSNPDPATVRTILFDPALLDALRYVAGPPCPRTILGCWLHGQPSASQRTAFAQMMS